LWKLLVRTVLFGPAVLIRNWRRRLRGRFPVIILFHHLVTDRPHHLGIPTELFLLHAQFLHRHYRVVSLAQAIEMLKSDTVRVPTVVLTFDDGYRDNFINLRAATAETNIPVTLFICTQNVTTQQGFEHDPKRCQRSFPPLTWEQVGLLSQEGFEVGSHTRFHFDCGSTDYEALSREIVGSKNDLEQHLGPAVKYFSFPYGKHENMSLQAIELAKRTYSYVFSAYGGANFASSPAAVWHMRRRPHPNDLWELELALQSVLDL
jgi:peptidoglycan/xylan/chitin deacetylase (PgdA/CDA1 family)